MNNVQQLIISKYKWEIIEHISGKSTPIYIAKNTDEDCEYLCYVYPSKYNKIKTLLEISNYENFYNFKLPILPIMDYKNINDLIYIFIKNIPSIQETGIINEKSLLRTIIILNEFNNFSKYNFLYSTGCIYYENGIYYVNPMNMCIGNPKILFRLIVIHKLFKGLNLSFANNVESLISEIRNLKIDEDYSIIKQIMISWL